MARKTTARRTRRPAPKTTSSRPRARRANPGRSAERYEDQPEAPLGAGASLALAPAPEPLPAGPPLPAELTSPAPEIAYADRMPPLPPESPIPTARRAIFLDVENSSHVPHVDRVIRHLALDRRQARTDFVAVGNWRVIGHEVARLLARHGAHLLHSAPSTGVRDWSDLRIAVAAGVWMAAARPGDRIEIVSDDRAFDAVGDVASSLGVDFYRLSYRLLTGAGPAPVEPAPAASSGGARGRRRGRGRGRSRSGGAAPSIALAPRPSVAAPRPVEPAPAPAPGGEPHTAPHDEIIEVVRILAQPSGRPVLIDTLARELKRRGFGRTPGSPRLITRLRRIKELAVSSTGMITVVGEVAPPGPGDSRPAPALEASAGADADERGEEVLAERSDAAAVDADTEPMDDDEGPQPGNEREPVTAAQPSGSQSRSRPRGRRRRRGGRRRPSPSSS